MCEEMLCNSGFNRKGDSGPALTLFTFFMFYFSELYESVCEEYLLLTTIEIQ